MIAAKGEQCILAKTAAEISLKSHFVENFFLRRLRENIRVALKNKKLGAGNSIRRLRGRLVVKGKNLKKISMVLDNIFGIHSIIFAQRFENPSLENIVACSVAFSKTFIKKGDSFAVRAHKCGNHLFSSHDLNVRIGAGIQKAIPGLKVNLDAPKKQLFVEVQAKEFFLYNSEKRGLRGLPLGVEGNVAFFFEGKKPEILAAWLLMKRGCNVFPVINGKKAASLVKKLVPWNSWRDFQPTGEKDLQRLVKERGILALATADAGISKKDFEGYKEFDGQFALPVLRPLLLLPKKELNLPKGF